jgi:DNA-directed RNA polymerase sigma subunit (sigma70/sigma32)
MLASCALDMSDDGPRTLDQVAALMGMSKERARQLEASAFAKLRLALGSREYDDLDEGF